MANRQPFQFPLTPGLTLTDIVVIQDTAGGVVYKASLQDIINFFNTFGVGGSLMFQLMADLKATIVLANKSINYITLGDPSIPEDGAEYYYDSAAVDADNGRSILIPDSIIFPAPGRFIQRQ